MENRYIHTINFPSSLHFAQLFPTKKSKRHIKWNSSTLCFIR